MSALYDAYQYLGKFNSEYKRACSVYQRVCYPKMRVLDTKHFFLFEPNQNQLAWDLSSFEKKLEWD